MREAQDQPSCVIHEPGPGTPPLTWQGLGATFREDHKTVSAKKKKKIWECTPQNPTSAVNRVAGFGFVSFALKNVPYLHREPLLGLRFTASSLQDRLVPRRASQDPGDWSSCASWPLTGQASCFPPFHLWSTAYSSPKLLLT